MKKFIFFFVFAVFFWFAGMSKAVACSCLAPVPADTQTLVKTAYRKSALVFSGDVLKIIRDEKSSSMRVTLRVGKSWKNRPSRQIVITTGLDSAGCGFAFEIGKKYLVFANKNGKKLETNLCTRTHILDSTNEDVAFLNKIKKPISPR